MLPIDVIDLKKIYKSKFGDIIIPYKFTFYQSQYETYENMQYRPATEEEMKGRIPAGINVFEISNGKLIENRLYYYWKSLVEIDVEIEDILQGSNLALYYDEMGIDFKVVKI